MENVRMDEAKLCLTEPYRAEWLGDPSVETDDFIAVNGDWPWMPDSLRPPGFRPFCIPSLDDVLAQPVETQRMCLVFGSPVVG